MLQEVGPERGGSVAMSVVGGTHRSDEGLSDPIAQPYALLLVPAGGMWSRYNSWLGSEA